MKTFALISTLFLYLPTLSLANLSSVPFGGVTLQLQSNSLEKDPEKLLVEVLTQTVQYLDASFTSLLRGDTDVSFSHIGLAVDTYDLNANVPGKNSVSFTFSGTAFFNSSPPPTTEAVLEMLAQGFLGKNSQRFARALMESDDPFLQKLSYAIVTVNGYVIPGGVLQGSESDTDSSEETNIDGPPFDIEQIALIAGSVLGSVLILVFCYCFWCVGSRSDEDEEADPRTKPTIKTSNTRETDDIEAIISPAPSSPQSIGSQASSVFTYNPQSRISFDASTMSTNTTHTDALTAASWKQKNTLNGSSFAPFGADISAIEMLEDNKRDLSLIEEGSESAATPVKTHLSKEYLSRRERRERSSRSRDSSGRYSPDHENSDVIEDLCNLSQQINHHRLSDHNRRSDRRYRR